MLARLASGKGQERRRALTGFNARRQSCKRSPIQPFRDRAYRTHVFRQIRTILRSAARAARKAWNSLSGRRTHMASPATPLPPVAFEDGLGQRRRVVGARNQTLSVLFLDGELTADPAFEAAL